MPSDAARLAAVHAALAPCLADYRESALLAAEEVPRLLASAGGAGRTDPAPALAASLGALGSSHLDVTRLAALLGEDRPSLAAPVLDALAAAEQVLREAAGAAPEVVDLAAGGTLAEAVGRALARIGRAYGAAHLVALARAGRYQRAEHEGWLQAYPFSRWNRHERLLAPPVVVSLQGADLRAGGLAEYLDGQVKLVLVVRDDVAPPAPLVRLVTPGVWLAQAPDAERLTALAAWRGPGVLAIVPPGAALFLHDPAASPVMSARLQLRDLPAAPRKGLGGLSPGQLTEELRQLEAMAGLAAAPSAAIHGTSEEPADRLAAWILSQVQLGQAAGVAP